MRTLFRCAQIDCVFDVGANAGQFRDFLRNEVEFPGTIVSFEPVPELYGILDKRSASDPDWHVHPCALGAAPGRAEFNVMVSDQFSSFLLPSRRATQMFVANNAVARRINVAVETLDEHFISYGKRLGFRAAYLKLDTQGFDLEVLRGGPAALTEIVALQTEASVKPIYEGMADYASSIEAIAERGFTLSATHPNNPDHFPELIEFDAHFVATRALDTIRSAYRELDPRLVPW